MTAQRTIKAAAYRRGGSEHDLQTQVLELIDWRGWHVFAFAIPNAARRSPAMATHMKAEGLKAGVADLCVMLPGAKVGWLEFKAARGKQSDAQREFEDICDVLGHPYALVRTLDEAIAVLKTWGALK